MFAQPAMEIIRLYEWLMHPNGGPTWLKSDTTALK